MIRPALKPEAETELLRAAVLLPLPLKGAYDYALSSGPVPRGTLVVAPLGGRETLGVVWGEAEGGVEEARLKMATPLEGFPRLPESLCDFVDWVARYTLSPPGMVLAQALAIGAVGAGLAMFLGIAMSYVFVQGMLQAIVGWELEVYPMYAGAAAAAALGIIACLLGGVVPAVRASRISIVAALRYE